MMALMQFDLVSPERKLASMEASAVQIPGAEGDLTAMPEHAPFMTVLRPGVLTVESPSGTQEFVVTGGFAEISPEGTSVLAEQAVAKADATREMLDGALEAAKAAAESATEDTAVIAAKRVNDFSDLIARLF
ncbi:MAG: F0F1 ATP synthase subunit epsilon [Pseudomonadota bacterium]